VQIAAVVLSLLLAVAMLGSGVMKLMGTAQMTESMRVVNVSVLQMRVLGVLEVLATTGLVVGLWVPGVGIAAAIGAVVYFLGAVVAHVRAHEENLQPAAVLFALAAATLVVLLVAP
jgi:uncharacterized membrane protein YphA (DoxX/SURF4 family)